MTERVLDTTATRVRVQAWAPNVLRITHAPAGAPAFPPDRPWLRHVLAGEPGCAPEAAELVAESLSGLVRVTTRSGALVVAEARPASLGQRRRTRSLTVDIPATEIRREVDETDEAVSLAFAIEPGEAFYGWGEWFNAFRRESGRVRLRIRDAIALLQNRETYSAIPLFYSSRGYALWLLNSHESEWVIDPARGVLEVTAAGPGADYVVIYGPAPADILAAYTGLTGRPPLLPRWSLGLMVTGYPQEPQDVMLARVAEHRQRGIPLDGLILDYHWEERYHNFQWRRSLFPDPDGLIARLREQGVRLGLIFTPFVNSRNRPRQRRFLHTLAHNLPAGCEHDDECDVPDYAEALERGLLAHPEAKWWFGVGGMLDFTNPEAAEWWNARLRPLYAQGIAFFKNDDGEYLPRSASSALGMTGREYHNLYGLFYGRAIYDGMQALDDRRGFIYARSVWAGSQRYPALFLGDQKPTYAHIQSTLRAGLNLGLLGFAHWTADVFGLDGKTTPELHRRYAQWALLAPVARYFWRPPAVDDTRFPWSHGPENEANFRRYARLRYELLPYYHTLGWQAYLTGQPVMRPLLLEFPEQPDAWHVDSQVMLGGSLLVAPVLAPEDKATGMAQRRVWLPAGQPWHDFWSTRTFAGGGTIDYAAPRDVLPLLVRGGSILPLGPALAHIPDGHRFDQLALHCYPPFPSQLVFYDDDGATRAYQRGAYSRTLVTVEGDYAAGRVVVRVGAAEGDYAGQPAARQLTLYLHRAPAPAAVAGNRPHAWRYEGEAVAVEVRAPVAEATEVEVRWA